RRDLVYRAGKRFATDVNALDQVRDLLEKTAGVSHSGLLNTLSCTANPEGLFIVSEWLPGIPLSVLIAKMNAAGERWSPAAALYLSCEIASILCYLHRRGIVHRQVRPENIFVTFSGELKLLGLGMAELESFALSPRNGHFEGLANYASPELASGHEVDGRSDLFSLGAILWELIGGRPLFPASSREEWARILNEKTPPPPSQASTGVPPELDTISAKLLDRDRYLRYELGERAAQDMSAVLKFRFPDFGPAEFSAFCDDRLADLRAAWLRSVERSGKSEEETAAMVADRSTEPTATMVKPAPAEPAPAFKIQVDREAPLPGPVSVPTPWRASAEAAQITQAYSTSNIQTAIALCACVLISLPFVVPKILTKVRASRTTAQMKKTKAKERHAKLHLITKDEGFAIEIDGMPATIIDNQVEVPANREIVIHAEKAGYEDLETVTQLMPDEEYDLPIEFTKSAAPGG
ncbi:MAG: serine/threonine protein kinase, partial [Bdellovibrionota bacterium]